MTTSEQTVVPNGVTPNQRNVDRVIAAIRNEDNFFKMTRYENDDDEQDNPTTTKQANKYNCSTPACICGWANFLNITEDGAKPDVDYGHILGDHEEAGRFLSVGASYYKLRMFGEMFAPDDRDWKAITRQEAIDMLENFKVTGEVVWGFDSSDASKIS